MSIYLPIYLCNCRIPEPEGSTQLIPAPIIRHDCVEFIPLPILTTYFLKVHINAFQFPSRYFKRQFFTPKFFMYYLYRSCQLYVHSFLDFSFQKTTKSKPRLTEHLLEKQKLKFQSNRLTQTGDLIKQNTALISVNVSYIRHTNI